jgi:hypothetical protein
LQLGDSSIRHVAEYTGINRGSVYESLGTLTKVGLAGFVAYGERRRYVAQDPRVIEQIVNEKQAELQRAKGLVGSYAAHLHTQATVAALGSFATLYEGDEGLATILRDVIATLTSLQLTEYHVISSPAISAYLYHNFPHFTRERIRHQLFVKVISMGVVSAPISELAERRNMYTASAEAMSCYTILYGPKTALISLGAGNIAQGIVVDSVGVTSLQRETFWKLWGVLT